MAFLCGPRDNDEFGEQPTEPIRAQPDLRHGPPLRPSFDPSDFAETWPELLAVEDLVQAALRRNRERPCPLCIYVRVIRDGEVVEIGPQIPRLCEDHMYALCKAGPADRVWFHQIIRQVFDWYHAPPAEYSD